MTEPKDASPRRGYDLHRPGDGPVPRAKFGTAADGWDAYNNWLDRVRQQPGPTSRQAVVSKALYSLSSYKNWADKARSAFDEKN